MSLTYTLTGGSEIICTKLPKDVKASAKSTQINPLFS